MKKIMPAMLFSTLLVCGAMSGMTAPQTHTCPLWHEFWLYSIRVRKTTQITAHRDDLLQLATPVGPPPASDAVIIRKNYVGGKVRALFILSYDKTRYPLELAARFDLDYDMLPVSLFSKSARAGDGFAKSGFNRWNKDFDERLLTAIENGGFDVIVAHGFHGDMLSPEQQQRLTALIKCGMGWVDLGFSRTTPAKESAIHALLPITPTIGAKAPRVEIGRTQTGTPNFICAGFPSSAELRACGSRHLRGRAVMRLNKGKGVVIAVREEGDGRLASYSAGWPQNEAECTLLMKTIIWAARKDLPTLADTMSHGSFRRSDCIELTTSGDSTKTVRTESGIPVRIIATPGEKLRLDWELRDEAGVKYDSGEIAFDVASDKPATLFIKPSLSPPVGVSEAFYAVRNEHGNLLTWGQDTVTFEGDLRLNAVELPDFFDRTASELTGTLHFESVQDTESEVSFTVQLLDSHARRLPFDLEGCAVVNPGGTTAVDFAIPCDFEYLFGSMGFLQVQACFKGISNAPFARKKIPFFAPRPPHAAMADWQCGAYGGAPRIFFPAAAHTLREYGFNAMHIGVWHYPDGLMDAAREGFFIQTQYIAPVFGHFSHPGGKDGVFSRAGRPVPWTADGRVAMGKMVERVRLLRKLGVVSYACTEEVGLGSNEVCFAEYTQALFRDWTMQKYSGLERLNAAWGTDFENIEAITGIRMDNAIARKSDNPAQWMDFRMFMENLYNGALEEYCRLGKTLVPDGFFGYNCGPYSEMPAQGHNRARLGKTIGSCVEYLGPWLNMGSSLNYFDILRSRQVPMLLAVSGYPTSYLQSTEQYQHNAWYVALHGGKGVMYYATIHPPWWAKLAGNGAPIGATALVNAANDDLLNGLGRVIIDAKRSNTGVGIYYSRPSQYALAWRQAAMSRVGGQERTAVEQKKAEALRDDPGGATADEYPDTKTTNEAKTFRNFSGHSFAAMRELVTASGFNYDIVFEDQLLSGQLSREFKVLLLPTVVALSDAEIKALRNFTVAGGLLMADMETGIYDELGRPNPSRAAVDALFGIVRDLSVFGLSPVNGMLTGRDDGAFEGYGTGGAKIQGGHAQAGIAGQDVFIINTIGTGKSVYLNFIPKRHGNWSNVARDTIFVSPVLRREFIRLAESVGAMRPIILKDDATEIPGIDNTEIVRFDNARNRYVFFHRKFAAIDKTSVTARLEQPLHVYDIRKREYIGFTDTPTLTLPAPAHTAAYAFLDHRVTALHVAVPKKVRAGDPISIGLELVTEGALPQNHVVHLEVLEPDGRRNWRFMRNIDLPAAHHEILLRTTLAEKPGQWKIIARDVQSGVMGEAVFMLAN